MSYSKTYTGNVRYYGSASYTVHYPASESGGSISGSVDYAGSVPVSVNLYVDTLPFDNSVDDCRYSVNALNGAVIAMNGAQVSSIHQAADDVSDHVINGFFNMIGSELSQNIAALFAKFKALHELMETKAQVLQKQQIVMQDDYSRISGRYEKIFQNLDEELEKEVMALDKNVFELSKQVQSQQLQSLQAQKVSEFLLGINESEIVNQELLVANTKAKVVKAIDGMAQNVMQESCYSKKVEGILNDENPVTKKDEFIPVIYTEFSDGDFMQAQCFSNLNASDVDEKARQKVKGYFKEKKLVQNSEAENKKIDEAFSLIAEKEFLNLKDEKSLRVYNLLKELKEKSKN